MPCFPGAQGFGTTTTHGRFGAIVRVTNFDDGGLGSYRDALLVDGAASIYFDVSGTIDMPSKAVKYKKPFKRVSGQTSPKGIAFSGEEHQVQSHDMLLECLRVRTGDVDDPELGWDNRDDMNYGSASDQTGVFPFSTYNIVNYRCSNSWSVDENNTAWYATHDCSWIEHLSFEALNFSHHPKTVGPPFGPHSMGQLCGIGAHNLSYYRCVIGSCNQRNPQLAGVLVGIPPGAYCVDVRNCYVFNWGDEPLAIEHLGNRVNIVGVYFRVGPNHSDSVPDRCIRLANDATDAQIYISDVIGPGNPDGLGDPWNCIKLDSGAVPPQTGRQMSPFATPTMTTIAAKDVPASVLATCGARRPIQDSVDARAVAEGTRKCWPEGSDLFVDAVNPTPGKRSAGGWPVFSGGTPPLDSNNDGVPDYYATLKGFAVMTFIGDQDAGDGESWSGHYLNDLMSGATVPPS